MKLHKHEVYHVYEALLTSQLSIGEQYEDAKADNKVPRCVIKSYETELYHIKNIVDRIEEWINKP